MEATDNGTGEVNVDVKGKSKIIASPSKQQQQQQRRALRASLFEPCEVERLQKEYKASEPYQHLVIPDLMDDAVLRGACEELKTNMQATLKETDIFKVSCGGVSGGTMPQSITWLHGHIDARLK